MKGKELVKEEVSTGEICVGGEGEKEKEGREVTIEGREKNLYLPRITLQLPQHCAK